MTFQREPPAGHSPAENPAADETIEARVMAYAEAALNALPP
jgi:hypothetical protein